jgi:hypothetical protein
MVPTSESSTSRGNCFETQGPGVGPKHLHHCIPSFAAEDLSARAKGTSLIKSKRQQNIAFS